MVVLCKCVLLMAITLGARHRGNEGVKRPCNVLRDPHCSAKLDLQLLLTYNSSVCCYYYFLKKQSRFM
jgi:thioredoxin-related protein